MDTKAGHVALWGTLSQERTEVCIPEIRVWTFIIEFPRPHPWSSGRGIAVGKKRVGGEAIFS